MIITSKDDPAIVASCLAACIVRIHLQAVSVQQELGRKYIDRDVWRISEVFHNFTSTDPNHCCQIQNGSIVWRCCNDEFWQCIYFINFKRQACIKPSRFVQPWLLVVPWCKDKTCRKKQMTGFCCTRDQKRISLGSYLTHEFLTRPWSLVLKKCWLGQVHDLHHPACKISSRLGQLTKLNAFSKQDWSCHLSSHLPLAMVKQQTGLFCATSWKNLNNFLSCLLVSWFLLFILGLSKQPNSLYLDSLSHFILLTISSDLILSDVSQWNTAEG